MAQAKKVFEIVINGIRESIDNVKSLNEELKDLETRVKGLSNKQIKIKVDSETTPTTKTKVSGNTGSSAESAKDLAIQKQITAEKNAQAKLDALSTTEGAKAYQNQVQINRAIKERKKELEASALLESELPQTLANTENELLAQIKLWDSWIKGADRGQDGVQELVDKYSKLSEQARKTVEEFQIARGIKIPGVFDAKIYDLLLQKLKTIPTTLNGVSALKKEVIELRNAAESGTEEFDRLTEELERLSEAEAKLSGKPLKSIRAEDIIDTKLTVQIQDMELQFDDVNQAIGVLEDKLYALTVAGEGDSDMAKELTDNILKLKNVVVQTDAAIDSMTGSSKGLKNVMSIVTGFTGIASIGQGLATLFGGQNEELDKSLQKFAGLSLVLQGLEQVQKEMAANTTAFGKTMNAVWGTATKTVDFFTSALGKAYNAVGNLGDKAFLSWNGIGKVLDALENGLNKIVNGFRNAEKALNAIELQDSLTSNIDKFLVKSKELKDLYDKLDISEKKFAFQIEDGDDLSSFSDEFREFADKLEELKKSSHSLSDEYDDLRNKSFELTDALDDLGRSSQNASSWATKLGTRFPVIAKGMSAVSKGITAIKNGFKALMASTLILAAIQIAFELISKAVDQVTKAINWMTGKTDKVDSSFDHLGATIEATREKLRMYNDELRRMQAEGVISAIQATEKEMVKLAEVTLDAGNKLKQFIAEAKEAEKIDFSKDYTDTWFNDSGKSAEEFKKKYNDLVRAVLKGEDEVKATGKGSWNPFNKQFWKELWSSADDAKSDLVSMQEALLKNIQFEISQIDFSKGEAAYKEFMDIITEETNASALANIDKLFPEDKWMQTLKARIESYKEFAQELYSINTEIIQQDYEAQKTIEQNNIAAIQQRFKREKEELANQKKWELKEAEGNEALQASIRNKYATLERNLNKQQAREIRDVNQQIAQNYAASMKDGLEKRLKELEIAKQGEINAAKDSEINVQEQIKAINAKYDKLIADEKEAAYKNLEDLTKQRNEALLQIELEYLRNYEDIQRQIDEMNMQTRLNALDNQSFDVGTSLSFDVSIKGSEGIEEAKRYYDDLLSLQVEYSKETDKLNKEAAQQQTAFDLADEQRRFDDRNKQLKTYVDEQQKIYDEARKKGEITEEEYNTNLERIKANYEQERQRNEKQHNDMVAAINAKGEQELIRITQEGEEERKNLIANNLHSIIGEYGEYFDEVNQMFEETTRKNINQWGIINYKKEKQNLMNTKNEYENILSGIEDQYKQLQLRLEAGDISFGDFEQAKKELDGLSGDVKKNLKNVEQNLKMFALTFAQNIASVVETYMQQLGQIWSMFNDIMMQSYENQQSDLDKQKEILEEQEENLEESYQKQQEITEKYTDKINGIEDELKDARGERRQNLIDQLAAQREAQLSSLQAEQEIQKEKEANEMKQEALKKKQDALDKKRKQQEKRNNIVQATINVATAVTNALAVQPWFVGVALAAVAAAMGAVQIAKIKSQKYADGGLLSGKSHAQGGMKIQGTNIEVEGSEYVINKKTTTENLPMMNYINSIRRPITYDDMAKFFNEKTKITIPKSTTKFADGGQLPEMGQFDLRSIINYQQPQDDKPIVVSVVDIVNASDNLRNVQTLAGLHR